ncbi:nitrate reductase cytochrome c-type subunit [Terasakiella sp. A23]|uniref:nitrate reductase cytochrome c-type subunit n=1 Tax=Terasakiella sp. FCG-A23 TaxID=3080561 RepID=UPI002952BFE6|nr:nitrate reductase cytochrome c-type subunit [Terasakiella sp. A23]MDV7338292.1 nitrate reductase cytochrome c-type subunit [Terasakiella sp. A23]
MRLEGDKTVKRVLIPVIAVFAAAFMLMSSAMAGNVNSLRGDLGIAENNKAAEINKVMEGSRFPQNYRQQPPLIPHKIEKYQINLKVNQCMRCHNWQYAAKEGAPKISETHYQDHRTGKPLDDVVPGRWFCTQCHVPQVDAKPLVDNTFTK